MTRIRKGNILLQSSDEDLGLSLRLYFERKYYNVFSASNSNELLRIVKNNAITFAIFDDDNNIKTNIKLAESLLNFDSGIVIYFICVDELTEQYVKQTHPLFLTIVKPFAMRNILNKMVTEANQLKEKENKIVPFNIGYYKFNLRNSFLVFDDGNTLIKQHLTKKDKLIILMLYQNLGKLVPKHRILTEVWKKDNFQSSRCLDVYIFRIRKYLYYDNRITIENTHSVGFCMKFTE
ncbi:MAG: winged helix-turn-helix domain-containing protein [Bacteroidales bacterium]